MKASQKEIERRRKQTEKSKQNKEEDKKGPWYKK